MTDHARAIEAGARAIYDHEPIERDDFVEIHWEDLTEGTRDRFRHKAKACIEAAIASGALVPASAGLSAQLADIHDRIDHLEGGLQLLLAAAKAGDPHKEIIWRVEEELRQIERLRQLDTAPASGDNTTLATSATNRIAKVVSMSPEIRDDVHGIIQETLAGLAPASGDYVVVPKKPRDDVLKAGYEAWIDGKYDGSQAPLMYAVWTAMLHAASRTGGGK